MRILHVVESYDPSLNGMQQVVKQLSERLVALGHTVTIATSYHSERMKPQLNGVEIQSFKIRGNLVNGYVATNTEIDRYLEFVKSPSFEIVTVFAAQQWGCDLLLPILNEIPAKKVFVPTGFSQLFNPLYHDYFQNMQRWLNCFQKTIFLSNDYQDIQFSKNAGIENFEVIPNGAGRDEFMNVKGDQIKAVLGIPDNHLLILNVSTHTGLKGHSETIELFKKAKLKNATLLILGNKVHTSRFKTFVKNVLSLLTPISGKTYFPQCYDSCKRKSWIHNRLTRIGKQDNRILIKDLDRAKILQAYAAADIFLFTSNVECSPIVLFECLASKTPFLTTDVGNAKEIISWTGSGCLLPTAKVNETYSRVKVREAIEIFRTFVENKELREEMADCGYAAWLNNFTWEVISKRYESTYQSIL